MGQFAGKKILLLVVGLATAGFAAVVGYLTLKHEDVVPPDTVSTASTDELSYPDPLDLLPDETARAIEEDLARLLNVSEAADAIVSLRQRIVEANRKKDPLVHAVIAFTLQGMAKRFASVDNQTKLACFYMATEGVAWASDNPCPTWPCLLSVTEQMLREHLATGKTENRVQGLNFIRVSWEWLPYGTELNEAERAFIGKWKASLHDMAVQLLHAPDEEVRVAAVRAVAAAPVDEAARDALVGLDDSSPRVRRTTVLALADRPEVLPSERLLPLLNDTNYDVRTTVRIALQTRGLSQIEISLATMVFSPMTLARQQAARHIALSTAVDRVAWLKPLCRDEEPSVRKEAAQALAYVGTRQAIKELERMAASDKDRGVRQLAAELLAQLKASPTARLKQASHQR